jgi:hypothetical protein
MPTATPAGKSASKSSEKTSEKTAVAKSAAVKTPVAAKTVEKPKTVEKAVEKAPEKPAKPTEPLKMDYDGFLAKLTPKDRLNIERHITAIEELSTKGHARLWKRLAVAMMSMAPHSAKANGQQSMQFYIQDGKYRMQIFALEDLRDGSVHVYAADAIDEATKGGLFAKSKPSDEPNELRLNGTTDTLNVERLDGKVSNPAPFYKDMLGWNRRAIHITLPTIATDAQIDAACKLLVFGAKKSGALA